ncbi:hypothetical protein EYC80_006351 [Monilinia laxa]|uniref:RING-type domain-containing protein n=1 Tax=Monilinia laxa TaxID=61186 RepID=A0A5N6JUL8_MONLA|nr:hypothetical protein EYC80_006351 [Monilinia laxa]
MSAPTPAQAGLISSLSQDEIPIKLRCAICSRLAVNAFRLPCCDQAICETCHSTLPSSCPVCEHTPVALEDCKPHKSLRTTIKVFLRTEEKKRIDTLAKQSKETPPATPVENLPNPIESNTIAGPVEAIPQAQEETLSANETKADTECAEIAEENGNLAEIGTSETAQAEEHDVPQPSIEEIAPGQEPSEDAKQVDTAVDGENGEAKDTAGKEGEAGVAQTPAFGNGFGFDQSSTGGFPAMGFSGDFNQMQMMMAMQNGMAPGGFGNFPMMGMPGMNMDPMTMQNMMMNGGFGGAGMGMNGMNMGMGMGNFDSGVGAGFNNGWSPQQSWNVGPDNFNHPNAAGMGPGDYGANNSGFPQNAAGFNQGNYGRANQYNDFQNSYSQGYQGRGRGRGRGGWHQNRGGHGHGFNDHSQHLQQQFGQVQQSSESHNENGPMSVGPKEETEPGTAVKVDEFGRELRQDTPTNEAENSAENITQNLVSFATKDGKEHQVNPDDVAQDVPPGSGNDDFAPKLIQSLEANESAAFAPMPMIGDGFNAMSPVDPNMRYPMHPRGGFSQSRGGRGGSFTAMQPPFVKPVDVPINAPTGPKAMREGSKSALPNIRTQSFSIAGKASASARGSVSVAPESATQERGRTRSPSQSREKDRSRSRSKSKDYKRDRSRERRHRRRHRSASRSRSEDEEEIERRREKRRERRRRHEEEADLERDANGDKTEKRDDDDRRKEDENRSRSASPQESKRSSHRSSRRDRDKYRDREREDDKHRSSSHKHRSSHRSHRDERSRSRERERSERDREREHRHRQSRHASRDAEDRIKDDTPLQTPIEPSRSSRKSSLVSNGLTGIEIKGASSRNRSTKDINLPLNIPTGPKSSQRDHEREREKSRSSRHSESHRSRRDSERNNITSRDSEKERPEKRKEEVDPHTLEREARNRERLLKEAQRIAGLTSAFGMGRKRSRDEVDDASGRKGRKKGRRGGGDDDEARIARLEAERESSRWA